MFSRKIQKLMYIIALWLLLSVDFLFQIDYWTHVTLHLIVGIAGTLYILAMKS